MKTFLINPETKTIEPVETSADILQSAYRLIGCSLVQVGAQLPNGDEIIVDEEGLFISKKSWFGVEGELQPICGSGLLVRATKDGDWVAPEITIEELRKVIKFYTPFEALEAAKKYDAAVQEVFGKAGLK